MQGNYTWAELRQRHDDLRNSYPDIISEKIILGQSVEGNDIWAFKLSDNVNIDEDEPEILYTGLTHSREPLSMMNLFYFVQNLVNVYESDSASEENYLINERELWFVPVVNPDGYIYNEQIQPNGGGMHRKNRRETGCGPGTERGVDLNRNYGFGWGSDDIGSSPDPCSAVFRGDGAFSEPETQILRDFIINRNFKNVLHYPPIWRRLISWGNRFNDLSRSC
jgi:murein tripeptide amidase MpaA